MSEKQEPKSLTREQLRNCAEFTKEEQAGLLRISLNEYIRDYLTLEFHRRQAAVMLEEARKKPYPEAKQGFQAITNAENSLKAADDLLAELETRIRLGRELIKEVESGEFVV